MGWYEDVMPIDTSLLPLFQSFLAHHGTVSLPAAAAARELLTRVDAIEALCVRPVLRFALSRFNFLVLAGCGVQ